MKLSVKKSKIFLLSFGILLGIFGAIQYSTNKSPEFSHNFNLPNTSAWGPNDIQVTSGVPLITYEDVAICSDGAGGVIIAWSDDRYVTYHVYAQRVDSNGNVKWTTNGVPMWDPWYDDQVGVQVCSDGAGGAIIVWEDGRNGYPDLYAQRLDPNGNWLWDLRGVPIVESRRYQNNVQICSDGSGGAIITWDDDRVDANGADIYVQRINSFGNVLWTANGLNICNVVGYQWHPQICADGTGGYIIAWTDERVGSSEDDIYVQRINSAGAAQWTTNGVAICTAQNSQGIDDICSDGSGGAILAWGDRRTTQYYDDTYVQRVNSNGNPVWTMGGLAICTASGNQYYARLTISGSGGAIVTWEDHRGPTYDVYAQRINSAGTIQWTANGKPICNAIGSQLIPEICSDGSDGAIITWEDTRNGGSDIYAQRIGSNGVEQWTPNGTAVCARAAFQGRPQIVGDGSGHAFFAWEDTRTYSGRDIYACYVINSRPTSTYPSDIITSFERSANIEWVLSDDVAGGQYRVIANDSIGNYYEVHSWMSWTIGTLINISLDTTICGFFKFILEFYDNDGQYGASDTVLVTIMENIAPTSNHPDDIITVRYGSKTIDWILDDEWGGGQYRVLANDTNGDYYVFKNWTSWSPTTPINIPINTSIPGYFNYTIIYYDNQNKFGIQDTVLITILSDLIPICDHPTDIVTVLGDNQYIRWTLNDDYGGGSYRVIANNSLGNFYIWRPWQSWTIGERTSIPINRNELGVFNYTIEYYDSNSQYGMPDSVLVTVNQNNPPMCNHPEDIATTTEGSEIIQWILSDDYGGGFYRVIITTSDGVSTTWIEWTSWTINAPLNVPIDRSRTGVFNYTIEYRDIYSVYGTTDTVKVLISHEEEGFPLPILIAIVGGIGIAAVIIPVIYLKRRKN